MAQKGNQRTFDVLPDPTDFRDRLFVPTLIEVPPRIDLNHYLKWGIPVLDQGNEGACTGFALATVANYLLHRRQVDPDKVPVSPRMIYEMAKRYDEWPGEWYEGSSARGAMKGWHKHGICAETVWPYLPGKVDRILTSERITDAIKRPLGAYFRVNHKDVVAMHSALAEVEILFATAIVHEGWYSPNEQGEIEPTEKTLGGHAFAIVAYDENGFWVQNSWGTDWGKGGFARLLYDDWLEHGMDVWVARLGAPIIFRTARATATGLSDAAGGSQIYSYCDVRSHVVSVGNNGELRREGTYGTSEEDVRNIFEVDFPTVTAPWSRKRILLYAHGGLVSEKNAIQRVADYRAALLAKEIYPLAFIWKTDFWTTLTNILEDALRRRRPEGPIESAKDFLLDRLDDALEPLARSLGGKAQWDEIKENGVLASKNERGAARIVLKYLVQLLADNPEVEIHLVAHSAGSIFFAPLIQLLASQGKIAAGPMKGKSGYGFKINSCTLWAPAITIELFKQTYLPVLKADGIEAFSTYTLTDKAEQDDHCANIYHKSVLYLVSNAFENRFRIPLIRPQGEPILGMAKFIPQDRELKQLFEQDGRWILAPNDSPDDSVWASRCQNHGSFDDDRVTLLSTVARILGHSVPQMQIEFQRSGASMRNRREQLSNVPTS